MRLFVYVCTYSRLVCKIVSERLRSGYSRYFNCFYGSIHYIRLHIPLSVFPEVKRRNDDRNLKIELLTVRA